MSQHPGISVTLHFSVAYPTQWGQCILLAGSGALLGGLEWSKARQLSCTNDKDLIVWEATIVLPWKPSYTYKYALVGIRPGGDGQRMFRFDWRPFHNFTNDGCHVVLTCAGTRKRG